MFQQLKMTSGSVSRSFLYEIRSLDLPIYDLVVNTFGLDEMFRRVLRFETFILLSVAEWREREARERELKISDLF